MIKFKHSFLIIILFFFTNLKADLSNFEKGKDLFDKKKYDLAKFKFEQDIFNPKMLYYIWLKFNFKKIIISKKLI